VEDIEIDCGGRIELYGDCAMIEIAEIKSSATQLPDAKLQLKSSLIILRHAIKLLIPRLKKVCLYGYLCTWKETHKNGFPRNDGKRR